MRVPDTHLRVLASVRVALACVRHVGVKNLKQLSAGASETRSQADRQARVSLERKSERTRKTEPERTSKQGSWLSREKECDRPRERSQPWGKRKKEKGREEQRGRDPKGASSDDKRRVCV